MPSQAERESRLPSFTLAPPPRLVFGEGASGQAGEWAARLGARRVLVVTDPGIVAAGHARTVCRSLDQAGLACSVHGQVRENPTTVDVARCVEAARESGAEALVGLGGGSSMDTAKGCNFLLTNGGEMRDYQGIGKAQRTMLPLIAVPTTAGTGSECQSFALIADEETHQKMACGDPKAAARVALLDPLLTLSQPDGVTAHTGVDALSHALESAVTRARTPVSSIWSREAFVRIARALPRVLERGGDLGARADMQLGAAFSGMAIENSMLGAAHSAANPLTARYGIIHGEAVGIMLPAVLDWNSRLEDARRIYAELARLGGIPSSGEDGLEGLRQWLRRLLEQASIPLSLSAHGVPRGDLPLLAREASRQWTAQFNPRPLSEGDFEELYRRAA